MARRRAPAALAIAAVLAALPHPAVAETISTTYRLAPGQTRTFSLTCETGDADECDPGGRAIIEPPAKDAKGSKPKLSKVTVLHQGFRHQNLTYFATVRNANAKGTASVRVKLVGVLDTGGS